MNDTSTPTPTIWLLSGDIMSQLGGGFRQQRWCEYYLRLGYSVRLFYVANATSVAWIDIHTESDLHAKRRDWISSAPPKAGIRDHRFARVARLIKHTLILDLIYPSVFRLFFLLNKLKKSTPGVTILLCSSPPFSLAIVGAMMKIAWRRQVYMALDMRDLWSLHSAFPGPKAHKRQIERWVLNQTDDLTTVSIGLAERFKAAFGAEPHVVYNVATHAHRSEQANTPYSWTKLSPALRQTSVKIVYTGSIPYGFYDLDEFVAAVETTSRSTPDICNCLQFVFVGACRELAKRATNSQIPKDCLVFLPQMTHETIAEIQSAADALLFLGYKAIDNQGQVSIKLFEYFRRRKPILPAFIETGTDVDHLMTLYCGVSPHLTSARLLSETLSTILASGTAELPRAINSDADLSLLTAYDVAVSRIVAKAR